VAVEELCFLYRFASGSVFSPGWGFSVSLYWGWWLGFCLFFRVRLGCVFASAGFFFIPVGEEWSLFPSQGVMHWSVDLWFWVSIINPYGLIIE